MHVFQLTDLNAGFVLCVEDTADKVKEAANEVSKNRDKDVKVLSFGKVEGCIDILALLDETEADRAPEPVVFADDELKDEVCVVFWSSGTTALPKGIQHTHYSALNWMGWAAAVAAEKANSVTTTCFFHVGGFYTGTLALMKKQTYYHVSLKYGNAMEMSKFEVIL